MDGFRALVEDLAGATIGATFNQYRDSDGDDAAPDSPRIRCENLVTYLTARRDAPVLLLAEAGGWRGARYSGLSLYSERQFTPESGLRRSSRHPLGWGEPSATVMQAAIAPWSAGVVLWNLVPTHPRRGDAHSNRTPSRGEVKEGMRFAQRLIELLRPSHIGAVGRLAQAALGPDVPAIRHPSHGGAVRCTAEVRELLTGPWEAAFR
jgi:uracil-DNA glycosylase